jgi:hypothetical protein
MIMLMVLAAFLSHQVRSTRISLNIFAGNIHPARVRIQLQLEYGFLSSVVH